MKELILAQKHINNAITNISKSSISSTGKKFALRMLYDIQSTLVDIQIGEMNKDKEEK